MTNSNINHGEQTSDCTLEAVDLREAALNWLANTSPMRKVAGVKSLNAAWLAGQVAVNAAACLAEPAGIPGHPEKPLLVSPLQVEKRSMRTPEGRAALIHALAHIEFNAINLALDAVWRFADMPMQYYADWLKVAAEEAYHFDLLNGYLLDMGYQYGDFSGHNSLWEMAERTKTDVLARMALVPRTMEARGLDAIGQRLGNAVLVDIIDPYRQAGIERRGAHPDIGLDRPVQIQVLAQHRGLVLDRQAFRSIGVLEAGQRHIAERTGRPLHAGRRAQAADWHLEHAVARFIGRRCGGAQRAIAMQVQALGDGLRIRPVGRGHVVIEAVDPLGDVRHRVGADVQALHVLVEPAQLDLVQHRHAVGR